MRKILYPGGVSGRGSVGLLLLRVVMGAAFMIHGWPKIQDPMHWMDAHGGSGMPGYLQAAGAVSEFGGGLALILGFLTPLAALGIACTMAVAVGMVHVPAVHSFVFVGEPSWELAAVYLAAAIVFGLIGPGKLSLDALLFGCNSKHACGNAVAPDAA
jgi:putative oxidoreductase